MAASTPAIDAVDRLIAVLAELEKVIVEVREQVQALELKEGRTNDQPCR